MVLCIFLILFYITYLTRLWHELRLRPLRNNEHDARATLGFQVEVFKISTYVAEYPRYATVAAECWQAPLQCRSDSGCVACRGPGQCAYRGSAETPISVRAKSAFGRIQQRKQDEKSRKRHQHKSIDFVIALPAWVVCTSAVMSLCCFYLCG